MYRVNEEMEKTRQRQQCKSAVKSGLSNIKRLQSLAERTSELSRASKDLDDLLDQKRQEFGDVIERANNYNISSAPGAKRIRRLSNTRSQGLQKTEESKEEDIRRCEEEIKALKQKIADKRKELARSKNAHTDVLESLATMKVPSEFNPSRYMAQYDFFVAALQSELRIAAKDKSAYDATMTHIAKAYDQELREIIDMV
ncbi:hypothetical protein BGW41_000730 [Actinomortierella wolfii]|nr:hypothetical protein BGW41_000730 [Actinomortierella wolfii]